MRVKVVIGQPVNCWRPVSDLVDISPVTTSTITTLSRKLRRQKYELTDSGSIGVSKNAYRSCLTYYNKTAENYTICMRNAVLTTSNYAFYKSNTLRFSELLHYTNLISHRLSQQLHSVLSIYTLPHISHLLRPPYVIGQANIFLPCGFYLSFFLLSLFSSPNLSGRRLDVYHTSAPGVTLVRI